MVHLGTRIRLPARVPEGVRKGPAPGRVPPGAVRVRVCRVARGVGDPRDGAAAMPNPFHGGRIREPRCVPRGLLEYGAEEAAPWSSEVRPRVHTAALEKLHNHPTGEGRRRNIFPRVTPPEDKHPSKSGPPACSRGGPTFLTFACVYRNAAPMPSQRALSKSHGVLPRRKNRQLFDGRSGRGTKWVLAA